MEFKTKITKFVLERKKPYAMDLKELVKQIIRTNQNTELPRITPRELSIPLDSGKIIALVGARRSGKTFVLYDIIRRLVEQGVSRKNILYINFEDERLNFNSQNLDVILSAWFELSPQNDKVYFLFDEIQNIPQWEKFIRRVYDTVTKNIFLTGSNSNFLASDISTSLRGRAIHYEVFPFSFREYLIHLNIDMDFYDVRKKAAITNAFKDYLLFGGFPEIVTMDEHLKNQTLLSYYYVMIYKDLIERYDIKSPFALRRFIEKLANVLTKPVSINKVYNELRSEGYRMDKNFIFDLAEYLQNIYLAFGIKKYSYSYNSRQRSPRKYYFVDNGFLYILSFYAANKEYGKLLENAVFDFLRKHYGNLFTENIFYYANKFECDFLIFDREKPLTAIQVSYETTDAETLQREIRGLVAALDYIGQKQGFIITMDDEQTIPLDDKKIQILPAWKLMLQGLNL